MIRGGNRLVRKTGRRLAILLMAGLTALDGLPQANHLMTTASQALLIKRRQWLQLSTGALAALLAGRAGAEEMTGKWEDASIAKYTQRLFDWLQENFKQRAAILTKETGTEFKLDYAYMGPTEDRARRRAFEKYASGRLLGVASEKHVESCLAEFERVRQALAAAEAAAAVSWKTEVDVIAVKEGRIYDSVVTAGRLTVVLDNSPSMKPYLEALRKEISRNFPLAYFVEVNGCDFDSPARSPWFFCAPARGVNPFTPERHIPKIPMLAQQPHCAYNLWTLDAPGALGCMVDLMQADAIYWFCDFDDRTEDGVIREFARKAMARKVSCTSTPLTSGFRRCLRPWRRSRAGWW